MFQNNDTDSSSSSEVEVEERSILRVVLPLVAQFGKVLRSAGIMPESRSATELVERNLFAFHWLEAHYKGNPYIASQWTFGDFVSTLTIAAQISVLQDILWVLVTESAEISDLIAKRAEVGGSGQVKLALLQQINSNPAALATFVSWVTPLWLPRYTADCCLAVVAPHHLATLKQKLTAVLVQMVSSYQNGSIETIEKIKFMIDQSTVLKSPLVSSPVLVPSPAPSTPKKKQTVEQDEETIESMSPVKKRVRNTEKKENEEPKKRITNEAEVIKVFSEPQEEEVVDQLCKMKESSSAVVRASHSSRKQLDPMIEAAVRALGRGQVSQIIRFITDSFPSVVKTFPPSWTHHVSVLLLRNPIFGSEPDKRYPSRRIYFLNEKVNTPKSSNQDECWKVVLDALEREKASPNEVLGLTFRPLSVKFHEVKQALHTFTGGQKCMIQQRCQPTAEILAHLIMQDPPLGRLVETATLAYPSMPQETAIAEFRKWFVSAFKKQVLLEQLLPYSGPVLWQPQGKALETIQKLHSCDQAVFAAVTDVLRDHVIPAVFDLVRADPRTYVKLTCKHLTLDAVKRFDPNGAVRTFLKNKIDLIGQRCGGAECSLRECAREGEKLLPPSHWICTKTKRMTLEF